MLSVFFCYVVQYPRTIVAHSTQVESLQPCFAIAPNVERASVTVEPHVS